MNKMNLPSPFETSFHLQQNEIFSSFILYILENTVYECQQEKEIQKSSDEDSELDSDSASSKIGPIAPQKRSLPSKKLFKRRKLFKPAAAVTSKNKTTILKEVFDQVKRDPVRKIEVVFVTSSFLSFYLPSHSEFQLFQITSYFEQVRMPTEISVTETAPIAEEASGFGVIHPPVKSHETKSEKGEGENMEGCISATELAANRISERGMLNMISSQLLPRCFQRRLFMNNGLGFQIVKCYLYLRITSPEFHRVVYISRTCPST